MQIAYLFVFWFGQKKNKLWNGCGNYYSGGLAKYFDQLELKCANISTTGQHWWPWKKLDGLVAVGSGGKIFVVLGLRDATQTSIKL